MFKTFNLFFFFRYYDPELDSLDAKLLTKSSGRCPISKRKLIRTNLYTFTHGAIRDWWSDYHYVLGKSSTSSSSSTPSSAYQLSPYQATVQTSAIKYKSEWACLLLGARLLRSSEFNERLRSLKSPSNVRLILEQLAYLVRSAVLVGAGDEHVGMDVLAYLLTLYLPILGHANGTFLFLLL